MTEAQIVLFVLASLLVIMTPGQDMLLVMSRAVAQGSKAGVVTAAGVSVGLLGHTLLAGLGLGSILLASELLFTILKFVGAGYLVYLGIRLLLNKNQRLDLTNGNAIPLKKLFWAGALSNISNPKITIFYFAFLPQFVASDIQNPTYQLLLLGAGFSLLTFIIKGPLGYVLGVSSGWLRSRPAILKWIDRTSGTMLIALGLRLAFERRA